MLLVQFCDDEHSLKELFLQDDLWISFFFFSNIIYSQDNSVILVNAQQPKNQEIVDILELPGTVLANEEVEITTVVSEKIRKILLPDRGLCRGI